MELPYDPAILLLGIHLKETKTLTQKDICTPHVHSSIIYNSQLQKQPKCSSMNEWIKKLWYIYTMEYYSGIKKK